MRTIRLEIIRHGPRHNQLLSPLTEYMALCENHEPVTLRLPFEHAEFTLRMRILQYKKYNSEFNAVEIDSIASKMSAILSQVPGLIRELAGAKDGEKFHLRLVISPNELALLPFELANASAGVAGAGQSLVLGSQSPVCITREVRRVAAEQLAWPEKPKILFAAANPEGDVPLDAHMLALRQVIEPWLWDYVGQEELQQKIEQHVKVLPQASLRAIEEQCATGEFTHVHILAHGVELKVGEDVRYGLALHDRSDPSVTDKVDAVRLAKALRPPRRDGQEGFARPAVVTLAACDAGSTGSVVGAGASIAHALHDEGIPLVVASQFPLSFTGSVIMTRVLYEGMLAGDDPRELLVSLRRQLRTQAPQTHDWASIVAYAALPPAMDANLPAIRTTRALARLDAALARADRALKEAQNTPSAARDFGTLVERLDEARQAIERCNDPKAAGAVASADKRLAEMYWKLSGEKDHSVAHRCVRRSRDRYLQVFRSNPAETWALVQALVLALVLKQVPPYDGIDPDDWELARILSQQQVADPKDGRYKGWAYTNLIELYLIAPRQSSEHADEARKAFNDYLRTNGPTAFDRWSTVRQLLRYRDFFAVLNPNFEANVGLATELANDFLKSQNS